MQEKSKELISYLLMWDIMSDTLAIYRVLKYCTLVFSKMSTRVGSTKVSSLS